jgi:hypothetical protein
MSDYLYPRTGINSAYFQQQGKSRASTATGRQQQPGVNSSRASTAAGRQQQQGVSTLSVLATSSSDRPMIASLSSSVISSDLAVISRHRIEGADEVHIISSN